MSTELISARREEVQQAYNSERATNHRLFLEGNDTATAEYIFPNQMEDANNIVDKFYKKNRRVISIQKKTKVGADGLMIEIAKLLTTHIDDTFVVNPDNVRIITGMSNAGWEAEMIRKAPSCFKGKIFHHGKLQKAEIEKLGKVTKTGIKSITKDELTGLTNGLIIIDEIDCANDPEQKLQTILKEAGILDVKHMEKHNNRFVFISATMLKELYDLYRWGELHEAYTMTIPSSYIGHTDFLDMGIIKEFYPLNTEDNANRWIQEDIINNYGDDYRVHIVRVPKNVSLVQNACIHNDVTFRNHTSKDRLTEDEIDEFFREPLTHHIVLAVKGFFRRANLIPNKWKLRIGATHELFTKKVDNNVQIQGLPGRMTGYWRGFIEGGHKTGPYRTSIKAIRDYEKAYRSPFGDISYQSAGLKITRGKVTADPTMLSPQFILNLEAIELPVFDNGEFERGFRIFNTQEENEEYAKTVGAKRTSKYETNEAGFKICSTTDVKVHSLEDILRFTTTSNAGSNMDKKLSDLEIGDYAYRRYVCYRVIDDKSTECYVTIWVKRIKEGE